MKNFIIKNLTVIYIAALVFSLLIVAAIFLSWNTQQLATIPDYNQNGTESHIDSCKYSNGVVTVKGWAINRNIASYETSVYTSVNGSDYKQLNIKSVPQFSILRKDENKALGRYLFSGFTGSFLHVSKNTKINISIVLEGKNGNSRVDHVCKI